MKKKILFALPILAVLLWGATSGNIQWTQLASGSRHGTQAKGQSSDGTGTSGHCADYNADGSLTDSGSACGVAASTPFSGITTGSNSTATMTVATGGTLTFSGSGVVNSNQVNGGTFPASALSIGSNSSSQPISQNANALAPLNYVAGGGTANAQTGTYSPAVTSLVNGLSLCWLPSNANSNTTPTFAPNGLTAKTIVKVGGVALAVNDLTTTAIACARYDGTNWELQNPQIAVACANCTLTIASGTVALGTSAISSGTCATVVTGSATGTATTDDIMADFNADPTGVTGYVPSSSGMLAIIKYPTANTVNFKVCNNTASSVTPGAITLNYRVVR